MGVVRRRAKRRIERLTVLDSLIPHCFAFRVAILLVAVCTVKKTVKGACECRVVCLTELRQCYVGKLWPSAGRTWQKEDLSSSGLVFLLPFMFAPTENAL